MRTVHAALAGAAAAALALAVTLTPARADNHDGAAASEAATARALADLTSRLSALEQQIAGLEAGVGRAATREALSATEVWIKSGWMFLGVLAAIGTYLLLRLGAREHGVVRFDAAQVDGLQRMKSLLTESRAPPYIDTVRPDTGPVEGGIRVVVAGRHFERPLEVEVNGVAREPLTVSANSVEFTLPSAAEVGIGPGDAEVDLLVRTRGGEARSRFAYRELSVDAGTEIAVTGGWAKLPGKGFAPGVTVELGASVLPNLCDGDTLLVEWPARKAGEKEGVVKRSDGARCPFSVTYK